jgi:hypothetical protein
MKLCTQCRKTPWPFLFALFIASVSAFLTWLMLSFAAFDATGQLIGSVLMFIAAATTLIHYVISCMKRHCKHDKHGHASG